MYYFKHQKACPGTPLPNNKPLYRSLPSSTRPIGNMFQFSQNSNQNNVVQAHHMIPLFTYDKLNMIESMDKE